MKGEFRGEVLYCKCQRLARAVDGHGLEAGERVPQMEFNSAAVADYEAAGEGCVTNSK